MAAVVHSRTSPALRDPTPSSMASGSPGRALTPLFEAQPRVRRPNRCVSVSMDFALVHPARSRSNGSPSPTSVIWRHRSDGALSRCSQLPELAKGAIKHRRPYVPTDFMVGGSSGSRAHSQPQTPTDPKREADRGHNAAWHGLRMLGNDSWIDRVFHFADGAGSGYLCPAEFASVATRFERILAELGGKSRSVSVNFSFSFDFADRDLDGQVDKEDWDFFAHAMESVFGEGRCRAAALRFLGARRAEHRRAHRSVLLFDGFDPDASLVLIRACMKPDSPNVFNDVVGALHCRADPNVSLSDPHFNEYTPLIFLAMTQPHVDGTQAAQAIDALVATKADVHRECGMMPFGKLAPLRFASRLQNAEGLAALLRHCDVGDVFQWAAGEDVEAVMLQEFCKLGSAALAQQAAQKSRYDHNATILMKLYASPITDGKLHKDGAVRLVNGQFENGNIRRGCFADPNRPGLEGMTALMEVVRKGDIEVVDALLRGRALPTQQAHSGATPLHFAAAHLQPACAKLLLEHRAEPYAVDHAGFSPWMLIGEATSFSVSSCGRRIAREQDGPTDNAARRELFELLRPPLGPDEILHALEGNWEQLIDEEGSSIEVLTRRLRLHESLFFDERCVRFGSYEGRRLQGNLVARVTNVIIRFLQVDPLVGDQKNLTKYLLQASMGPSSSPAKHVNMAWPCSNNRAGAVRERLMTAVQQLLTGFAAECSAFRTEIDSSHAAACQALREFPADLVTVPESWQADGFWRQVQARNILRYDPEWAVSIHDGATCCRALLRLGTIDNLAAYGALQTVHRAGMGEMLTRGYESFSRLCNEPFQDLMKRFVARVASGQSLRATPPDKLVASKRLKRLTEKAREAIGERGSMPWHGRSDKYIKFSHCFYIMDTVRMSFICEGATLAEQVHCCVQLVDAFRACSVEREGLCMLRLKSGFASQASGKGGYADVKLLCYVDLGEKVTFDGSSFPLRIIGEIQLILKAYMNVKSRMHLAYEVDRGSFDNPA